MLSWRQSRIPHVSRRQQQQDNQEGVVIWIRGRQLEELCELQEEPWNKDKKSEEGKKKGRRIQAGREWKKRRREAKRKKRKEEENGGRREAGGGGELLML